MKRDNFNSVSGLANAISFVKAHPDRFDGIIPMETLTGLVEIPSARVFHFNSLFLAGSFRPVADICSGRVERQIDRVYLSGSQARNAKLECRIIREFIIAMNVYHCTSQWIYQY